LQPSVQSHAPYRPRCRLHVHVHNTTSQPNPDPNHKPIRDPKPKPNPNPKSYPKALGYGDLKFGELKFGEIAEMKGHRFPSKVFGRATATSAFLWH